MGFHTIHPYHLYPPLIYVYAVSPLFQEALQVYGLEQGEGGEGCEGGENGEGGESG